MPDSAIERTIVLPGIPRLHGGGEDPDVVSIYDHVRELHTAIAAAYDNLAARINEFMYLQDWQHATYAQITADQNNFQLQNAVVHRLSSDAPRAITGILAPAVSRFIICLNDGQFAISFLHDDIASDMENRVYLATAPFDLAPGMSAAFWYDTDPTVLKWRQLTL